MIKYVRETLTKIGKSEDSISKDEIKAFCKNARALRLLRYSTLQFEYDPKSPSVRVLGKTKKHSSNYLLFKTIN